LLRGSIIQACRFVYAAVWVAMLRFTCQFDTHYLTRVMPSGKVIWVNPTDGAGNVLSKSVARKWHRSGNVQFEFARTEKDLNKILMKGHP
jgi:hypothetical protein